MRSGPASATIVCRTVPLFNSCSNNRAHIETSLTHAHTPSRAHNTHYAWPHDPDIRPSVLCTHTHTRTHTHTHTRTHTHAHASMEGRMDEAIAAFTTALRVSPNNPTTLKNYGTLLYRAHRKDEVHKLSACVIGQSVCSVSQSFGQSVRQVCVVCVSVRVRVYLCLCVCARTCCTHGLLVAQCLVCGVVRCGVALCVV